ncbi:toxin-activating lysine-acyltransferase [Burkholderia sp. 22PA0099]|uniref:toxin-activating lysine-acyltransferase n=1 Tax=Burkholderia sp. 22PA0099 TaxID=3237372 RepID=UPI0039C29359
MKFKNEEQKIAIEKLGCLIKIIGSNKVARVRTVEHALLKLKPAIDLDQVEIFFRNDEPVGYVAWGLLTNRSLSSLSSVASVLHPSDWNEGDTPCILDLILPIGSIYSYKHQIYEILSKSNNYFAWFRQGRRNETFLFVKKIDGATLYAGKLNEWTGQPFVDSPTDLPTDFRTS